MGIGAAARRRRWRAWWYQRGLPRLIRARALLRHWCRRSRLGRVLCWPLPAPLLALLALAAQMAAALALLALLGLVSRVNCAADPCAWECRRALRRTRAAAGLGHPRRALRAPVSAARI